MKRSIRILIAFLIALAVVPFLPLYIERTFMRSWRVDRLADEITWGWKLCSLVGYWSDYSHLTREQAPAFWLKINVGLAFLYALLLALALDQFRAWRRRRMLGARAPSPALSAQRE